MTNEVKVGVSAVQVAKIDRTDAIALTVTYHLAGDKRQGDKEEITTTADKKNIELTKRLWDCAEYDAIRKHDGLTKKWIDNRSTQLMKRRGIRLTSTKAIPAIEKWLNDRMKERNLLVDAFINAYPLRLEEAKDGLKAQFKETDYLTVSALRRRFSIEWYYLNLGVPDNLPEDVKAKAIADTEKMWNDAAIEVRDCLRLGFATLVEHLLAMLQPDNTGKPQKFYASNIDKIVAFIDALPLRNLTNDTELIALAQKAKEIIGNNCGEVVQKNKDGIKDKIAKDFVDIDNEIGKMVAPIKQRKFDLD